MSLVDFLKNLGHFKVNFLGGLFENALEHFKMGFFDRLFLVDFLKVHWDILRWTF